MTSKLDKHETFKCGKKKRISYPVILVIFQLWPEVVDNLLARWGEKQDSRFFDNVDNQVAK